MKQIDALTKERDEARVRGAITATEYLVRHFGDGMVGQDVWDGVRLALVEAAKVQEQEMKE